ncbi:MAG: [Fe-Fe] hydrogenase large subunit C-terminal domain-containing protein [Lachnospiraceae bacterium]|nr:[Fe-Fe] hydrogenase large subunit C-terminal domain-containing protein [Lachnospiraceae bacterium]
MNKFERSVRLMPELCKGCINCIKYCPTQAIRVRNGKAVITDQYCIDCGECIRICQNHAKVAVYDSLDSLEQYEYTVALPAPTLYSQFNNLDDVNIVLTALLYLGFDDVFEVSGAAELVSEESRKYLKENKDKWPLISSACPSVVRLIRVRFPNLIEHLIPIDPPVEVAAQMARQRAMEQTGLPSEKIGIFFLSPCPSKVSYARSPLGKEKSEIDHVLAIKDIYPVLLPFMNEASKSTLDLSISGRIGIGWGAAGGEAGGLLAESYLAADGIQNVLQVLEDMENRKFERLQFIELNACHGGCVGGTLTVENAYVAKTKLARLRKYQAVSLSHLEDQPGSATYWKKPVEYEPVFQLGKNLKESFHMLNQVEEYCNKFPGLDCGSCGAPSCKALAEDIVRGEAKETDCIYLLKESIHEISTEITQMTTEALESDAGDSGCIHMLQSFICQIADQMERLDSHMEVFHKKEEEEE